MKRGVVLSPDVSALTDELRQEVAELRARMAALLAENATLRLVLSAVRKQVRNSLQTLIAPAATLIQDLSG